MFEYNTSDLSEHVWMGLESWSCCQPLFYSNRLESTASRRLFCL